MRVCFYGFIEQNVHLSLLKKHFPPSQFACCKVSLTGLTFLALKWSCVTPIPYIKKI